MTKAVQLINEMPSRYIGASELSAPSKSSITRDLATLTSYGSETLERPLTQSTNNEKTIKNRHLLLSNYLKNHNIGILTENECVFFKHIFEKFYTHLYWFYKDSKYIL
jgi:hypothetical protein